MRMGLAHQSYRTLSNAKLTRRFHVRFMGLWVLLTICLVFTFNAVLYLYVVERWGYEPGMGSLQYEEYQDVVQTLVLLMCVEMALFVVAIIGLAVFTAHRIGGLLLHLECACKAVLEGHLDYRLHLRDYDHLEDLELIFNQMVAKFRRALEGSGGGSKP